MTVSFSDSSFVASYFAGSAFGPEGSRAGLALREILYWHDGPVVFTAEGEFGSKFIVILTDENDEARTSDFLVIPISDEDDALLEAEETDMFEVNRIARSALHGTGGGRIVSAAWDRSWATSADRSVDAVEGDHLIGDDTDTAPAAAASA